MTGPLLVVATAIILSLLLALIAASLGIADWLERRRCICLYENWPAAIGMQTDEDGTEWIVYPRCPVHGRQARTPILDNETTASGQTLAV